LNAAARLQDMSYSQLMGKFRECDIQLDRKMLSHIAITHPEVFKKICDEAK